MAQWSNTDNAAGAPKWKSIATGSGTPNRGNTLFANVTSSAFINGVSVGTFGANVAEAQAISPRMISPGWVKTVLGTGPVTAVTATGGAGYVNGAAFVISGPSGIVPAAATIVTNGTGNVTSASVNSSAQGYGIFGIQANTGTITTLTTSTGVTGVGTGFTAADVGEQLFVASNNALIGTISAFVSATSVTLQSNALVAVSANAFKSSHYTVTSGKWAANVANATNGTTAGSFQGAAQIGYVNNYIVTITGGVTDLANATGGSGIGGGAFNIPGANGYVNGNIITISGPNIVVNAVANITSTNSGGGNFTLVMVNRGSLANATVNGKFTYTITQGTAGSLGNTSTTIFANSIVQTVLIPTVANIVSTNATGGNIQFSVTQVGVYGASVANQAFTYTITQGPGTAAGGNTSVSMFGNTILSNASAVGVVTTVTLGGRAGRILREPLVAMRGNPPSGGTGSVTP